MTDLLAEATAELYERDPEDFTTRRAEFAGRAREAGQSAVAKEISALRKPTRSAWVVNHLVRGDPDVTGGLVDLNGQLQDAVAGGGPRIRELTAARAKLVDELTQQALKAAGLASPPAALREEVTATLDAAIADPAVAAWPGSWSGPRSTPLRPGGRRRHIAAGGKAATQGRHGHAAGRCGARPRAPPPGENRGGRTGAG